MMEIWNPERVMFRPLNIVNLITIILINIIVIINLLIN